MFCFKRLLTLKYVLQYASFQILLEKKLIKLHKNTFVNSRVSYKDAEYEDIYDFGHLQGTE